MDFYRSIIDEYFSTNFTDTLYLYIDCVIKILANRMTTTTYRLSAPLATTT